MPTRYFPPLVPRYSGLLEYAEDQILKTYGQRVSVAAKGKTLNKFGRTIDADNGVRTTIARFQTGVINETFVSTNIIDSIVSSAVSTAVITIEGHTIDASGNLTFVTQNATLNGTTEVTLTTPLARANIAYVKNSTVFDVPYTTPVGNVYIYDNTGGILLGTPIVAAATKLMIFAGKTRSEKCATSISQYDYWLITDVTASIESGSPSANADFELEIRDVKNGGLWIPIGVELALLKDSSPHGSHSFTPYRVVPPNHDVRLIATATANNTIVAGDMQGLLAIIV